MLAVGLAVLVARWPNGIMDRLSLVVSMLGLSVAPYVLALVLIYLFAVKVQWFPALGYTSLSTNPVENIKSLTLPAISIGLPLFAVYTRLLRADIVEQLQREDYIVTARAKGMRPWRILLRHALPNSMFGLITLVALNLGTLIGATVIIEPIFSLPGVKRGASNEGPRLAGVVDAALGPPHISVWPKPGWLCAPTNNGLLTLCR